ncbi:hypothetical protein ElyMa_003922000 [Elysia marginata]|uniref:Uncharacterized protein n=1 Tax=Elysia marginata TaxID=1093978 RepID=A0AAV4FR92_9GAST|nr:hypothetical protein ElyMa_003922000 [Elysia marginata]
MNGFNSQCLSVITRKGRAPQPEFKLIAALVKRRLRFAGHILRKGPGRLLRCSLTFYLNSSITRPEGLLLHGLDLDTIPIEEGITLARNRRAWSCHINSLCL